MSHKHERTARIEAVGEDGTFQMILATEGEASDGHILSIRGGTIPDRMPLLTSHWNDPASALGSVLDPRKELGSKPPKLRATGQIEMGGPNGDVRRDIAHMISKGHLGAVSIRWDAVPGKTTPRINLPSDHPHFVDAETATGAERWGSFFSEWTAREGSIVALPADMGAVIERANETEGEVSAFWRSMADVEVEDDESFHEVVIVAPDQDEPDDDSIVAASLAALRCQVQDCIDAGATAGEVAAYLPVPPAPVVTVTQPFQIHEAGDGPCVVCADRAEEVEQDWTLDGLELDEEIESPEPETDPAAEPEQEADESLTSAEPEREQRADPLTAKRPLEALQQRLAEDNPLLQAKILRKARQATTSPLDLAHSLRAMFAEEAERAIAQFDEEVERMRGKVKDDGK